MFKFAMASPDRYELLKAFARENRKNATLAERVLWDRLKEKSLRTRVFRQHIVGDYIVDFLLPYFNLVIEVDGGYHTERLQQEDDQFRTEELNRMGLYVMRFSNEQILFDIDSVLSKIQETIELINK